MVAGAVSARRSPELVLPVLSQAVGDAMAWTGARGEADTVARWILAAASTDFTQRSRATKSREKGR